jgi:hypothetical protein
MSSREVRAPQSQLCKEEMGKCFAQFRRLDDNVGCKILIETYKEPGQCPFCKEKCDWTNDVWYPFDPNYGRAVKPGKEKEVSA